MTKIELLKMELEKQARKNIRAAIAYAYQGSAGSVEHSMLTAVAFLQELAKQNKEGE